MWTSKSLHLGVLWYTTIKPSLVCTNLALSTFGPGHDKAGVRQVPLAILSAVDISAATLHLSATSLDGRVNGNGVGAFGLLGSTVTLDLPTLSISRVRREQIITKKHWFLQNLLNRVALFETGCTHAVGFPYLLSHLT